jgi:hypothetical protein
MRAFLILIILVTIIPLDYARSSEGNAAQLLGEYGNLFHITFDNPFCPASCAQSTEPGITSDGIGFKKSWATCHQIPNDGRYYNMWITMYDEPIPANTEKDIKSVKNFLNDGSSSKNIEILNRIVDGRDAVIGNATNQSNSTDKKILASFWIDASNGFGKTRFCILSNSETIMNTVLGNLHLEKLEPNPAPPKSSDL